MKPEEKLPESDALRRENPFRVVGVALVVDQLGTGARLLARYPTQPAERTTKPKMPEAATSSPPDSDEDLFFTLTARQMAKLFRTKKALCGRPMTLNVNGTVFCCRAVLMNVDEKADETDPQSGQLELFSLIVAMSSPMGHTSVPFSSWLETATEDQLDIQRYIRDAAAAASTSTGDADQQKAGNGRVSSSFLSIRRVHLSLARYCRVLEREERRCQYITLQANLFFRIRSQQQKLWEESKAVTAASKALKHGATNVSSTSSVMSSGPPSTGERRPRHNRTSSLGTTVGDDTLAALRQSFKAESEDLDMEQEILELLLAAPAPKAPPGRPKHHGNLVRELVQLFHSLSRNDHVYPPTPAALLNERDGVVHVNQHIAVPIEAASLRPSQTLDGPIIRPYYTLLFPHASPSTLLQTFQSSGSAPPQRLQQLLLTVNAQKSLTEIALDANLPLHTTLEMASYLVSHGACVMSPVVSRTSRLACLDIQQIREVTLEFSQLFPRVHLVRLLAFLTTSKTLGEALTSVTDLEHPEGAWLRDCLLPLGSPWPDLPAKALSFPPEEQSPKGAGTQAPNPQDGPVRWKEEMEEQLFAMAVWLISHRVLAQMQEYLAVVSADHDDIAAGAVEMGTTAVTMQAYQDADENLFLELLESDLLTGNVSIMALSARLGLDAQKVRSWGIRHRRIRIVTRVPKPGDDWDE